MKVASMTLISFLIVTCLFLFISVPSKKSRLNHSNEDKFQQSDQLFPININTADLELLNNITGIGNSIAEDIIKYRNLNGHFKKIDDIKNVTGIGEGRFVTMKDELTI